MYIKDQESILLLDEKRNLDRNWREAPIQSFSIGR